MNFCIRETVSKIRRLAVGVSLAGSMLVCGVASAVAPAISPSTITLTAPETGSSISVNLRNLGVLTGSAPLTITSAIVLLNNQTSTSELIGTVSPSSPGRVCVTITNLAYDPSNEQTVALRLTVSNPKQQTAGPITVPVDFSGGPSGNLATCGDPNTSPIANAGQDRAIPDTDDIAGENVVLDGSLSSDVDAGSVLTYEWRIGSVSLGAPSTNPQLTTRLPDGVSSLTLTVTDDSGDVASASTTDALQITVNPQLVPPTVNAGVDQTVADTDGLPGEAVTLTGTGTDTDGTIASYQWLAGTTVLGSGATLQTSLPDGVNTVTLLVTDNAGNTGTDTLLVTVNAGVALPVVNAGADRVVADTDREVGENVTLAGSATTPVGSIQLYQWLLGTQVLGTGATLQARLPDGVNIVTLRVTNSLELIALDTVQITVGVAPARVALAELPNLSATGKSVATALDRICTDLDTLARSVGRTLTAEEQALRNRCDGLYLGNTVANQVDALEELVADDFAVARTQTLLFANTQYASVMDRLMALRGGARGLSLAGLNVIVDGKPVPLAQLQDMVKSLLGGGASADTGADTRAESSADRTAEPGGLLSDKWGMWARGNYSFGEKDTSPASPSFDADQWSMVGGLDYRLSDKAVIGGAIAYGSSSVEFNPSQSGALDSESWAGSLYGSVYAGRNFYFDGIVNVASAGYDAERNITYVDGSGLINNDAQGSTDGKTVSGGLSAGYDFLVRGITLSPTLGLYYIDATIDSFTESGAVGLNLRYDEQNFKSLTGNLGFRATYAMNLSWGVLLPHVRIDYVREFENDVDVFGVRFAADPNATSAPPILVTTENPDESYWRLAGGFSAQFKFGFSGYIEYQRLQSFQFISFQDVSVGLRMQRSF